MKRFIVIILLSGWYTYACAAEADSCAMAQFRAAWFSTVANIDWPTKEAVGNSRRQKEEMIALLNQMEELHLNTVIFQVRPTADALYRSDLEPWSAWLTGKQGVDNDTTYDPLAFMIEQAHQRRMDVHVWINPYRVTLPDIAKETLHPSHLIHNQPKMFWKYGTQWYFEPGLDETREWLCKVVADLVRRYDIQAIHMDDYFYPYPIPKQKIPDEACFKAHPRGYTDIGDWRRNNVNMAIKQLHDTIKQIKPEVEFGISPFGIWRNKTNDPDGSETNGLQNYDELYADVLLWMKEGWIDYVVPQLYWEIGKSVADHAVLTQWWAEHCYGTKLYIGMMVSRLRDPRYMTAEQRKYPNNPWAKGNEICRQMRLHQQYPQVQGEVFFSLTHLLKNPLGLCDSLKTQFFTEWVQPPK